MPHNHYLIEVNFNGNDKIYYKSIFAPGFRKTDLNHTFGMPKITNLKYSTDCESLVLGCSNDKFTV